MSYGIVVQRQPLAIELLGLRNLLLVKELEALEYFLFILTEQEHMNVKYLVLFLIDEY